MTRLFIRFYIGVLIVLSLAWYIHSLVLESRSDADLSRVIVEAHSGGARMVTQSIANSDSVENTIVSLQTKFDYPIAVVKPADTPQQVQDTLVDDKDAVTHYREGGQHYVVTSCGDQPFYTRLGPLPNYRLAEVKSSLAGWMRLAAERIGETANKDRSEALDALRDKFEIGIQLSEMKQLPSTPAATVRRGGRIAFFKQNPQDTQYYSAIKIANEQSVLVFGPFPSFERIEQKAATTTLALVLLPAALAIAVLLRPVARQLRNVEDAAKAIASGDLEARVDESRVSAARPLAQAFNQMADQNETLLRSQRDLLQAVSHELRTPLARIQFASELIGSANDDEERATRLQAVANATDQLDGLVGELLAYVRAEFEAQDSNAVPVSIEPLFSEIVRNNAGLFSSVTFCIVNETGNTMVAGNRKSLHRVISNLVLNAARFAKSKVRLGVTTTDNQVLISIEDDGPGIPENEHARVFEPFVRLGDQAEGVHASSGLGLALVQRIVKGRQGDVSIHKSDLGGAKFLVALPQSQTNC